MARFPEFSGLRKAGFQTLFITSTMTDSSPNSRCDTGCFMHACQVALCCFFQLWPYVAEEFVLCFAESLSWKLKSNSAACLCQRNEIT